MPRSRRLAPLAAAALAASAVALGLRPGAPRADTVELKNGIVYRGTVDRDKPLLWVYDGLKRVVLRDSKVARIESDAAYRNLETFRLEQPLVVHGGAMPKEVVRTDPGPWNDRGRRPFAYEGSKIGKVYRMEQAINEMNPYLVKIRGVDGFWQSQLALSRVPREIVLAILGKVERADPGERIRVARFLIQAEWYDEARAELDAILKDFAADPDLKDRVAGARASLAQLSAAKVKASLDRARAAQQPRAAAALLKAFPEKDVSGDLVGRVDEMRRAADAQAAADKALADDLSALADGLTGAKAKAWKGPLLEALKALKEAPDAVRDRFSAAVKAKAEGKAGEARLALALSGYVAGPDAAVDDLDRAAALWVTRDQVRAYLGGKDVEARESTLAKLGEAKVGDPAGQDAAIARADLVTRLARLMPPPLHDDEAANPSSAPKLHRVGDDDNEVPTEYSLFLPPEYHPLRSYPAVVALHDGRVPANPNDPKGPAGAVAWWSAEAAKRGYIVIAPEYLDPAANGEYGYSVSEHAAVELALRDARKRYAIDSDRVFVGGQLVGANAAWDIGLAHPDEFAGVVVVSGLPFKYVNRYLPHAAKLPLYVVLGDLAPAANEVVFGQLLKPLINKNYDVTYLEYLKRGLEDFPEEAPAVFDWMDQRRRDPYPKAFEAESARPSDNRFYGAVLAEFAPGRLTDPKAVDGFGKNLNPAGVKMTSSTLSNLLNFTTKGVTHMDVWVSPKLIDFKRKLEIRWNGKSYKKLAEPELEDLLEDLRVRGDRQQVYWLKVSA